MTLFILSLAMPAHAEPWFTGPILAPAGETIPTGHVNVELYAFYTTDHGRYNRHGRVVPSGAGSSQQYQALLSYGFTDYVDMQFTLPYLFNSFMGQHGHGVGDANALLGFQALRQSEHNYLPDLRILLQEILPSGRYENLTPSFMGTSTTGKGSYQTIFSLAFQYLSPLPQEHYLRTRLTINYSVAASTTIQGISAYGGNQTTVGRINPGNTFSVDLAGELTLNQNWVAVMEAYYSHGGKTTFRGTKGLNPQGVSNRLGYPNNDEITLAPAIEYNYSANLGIIAGYWYVVKGKSTANFKSPVVALNLYW